MIKKVHACNRMNFSSNINEAIRAVLISFFFLQKDFTPTKSTKSTKKQKKTPKSTKKHQREQKCNQPKAQNTNKQTKIKNALKKHLSGKK